MRFNTLFVLCVMFVVQIAAEAAQPDLPSLKDLKSQIAATRNNYSTMSVEWEWAQFSQNPGEPRKRSMRMLYRLERVDSASLMERWQLAADGSLTKETAGSHYYMVFDGSRSTMVEVADHGRAKRRGITWVEIQPGLDRKLTECMYQVNYYETVWRDANNQAIDEEIGDSEWKVSLNGWETLSNVQTLSLTLDKNNVGAEGIKSQRKMWLDPAHSWMAVRTEILLQRPGEDWKRLSVKSMGDFREIDGVWVPFKVEFKAPNQPDPMCFLSLTVSSIEFGDKGVRRDLIEHPFSAPATVVDHVSGSTYSLDKKGVRSGDFPTAAIDASLTDEARSYATQANEQRAAFQKIDSDRVERKHGFRFGLWSIVGIGVGTVLVFALAFRINSRRAG